MITVVCWVNFTPSKKQQFRPLWEVSDSFTCTKLQLQCSVLRFRDLPQSVSIETVIEKSCMPFFSSSERR